MKLFNKLLVIVLLLGAFTSCDTEIVPANGYMETTQEGASTFVLQGYEDARKGFNVFTPANSSFSFYLKEKAFQGSRFNFLPDESARLDEMKQAPEQGDWKTSAEVAEGRCYWVRYDEYVTYHYMKLRVAYVAGNNVGIEYAWTDQTSVGSNVNANVLDESGYSLNLEMPHLNTANVFVAHSLTVNGAELLDYALEWDDTKKHSAWVAFSFDETTRKKGNGVVRGKDFFVDPLLPPAMQVTNDQHKNDGFDRGHLCGSADRLFTQEANDQTFYFSNMSPMIPTFNSPYWAEFERQVRKWGGAEIGVTTTYSKLYVVKGGALNELLAGFTGTKKGGDQVIPTTDDKGFTKHGLACPKYYFMAVLSETDGVYHAIGFRMEHKEYSAAPTMAELKAAARSIDKLEQETGIDFFCNLPDDLENAVESNMSLDDWAW